VTKNTQTTNAENKLDVEAKNNDVTKNTQTTNTENKPDVEAKNNDVTKYTQTTNTENKPDTVEKNNDVTKNTQTTNTENKPDAVAKNNDVTKNTQTINTENKPDAVAKKNSDKNTQTTNTENKTDIVVSKEEESEIKKSPEYITFSNLNRAVKKYETLTENEIKLAKDLKEQSEKYNQESEAINKQASLNGNEEEKKIQLAKSLELKKLASEIKIKADSVNDLANNTKAFTESKKLEYETFTEGLDDDLFKKIQSIDNKENNKKENLSVGNTDEQNNIKVQYSESYSYKMSALEKEYDRFETNQQSLPTLEEIEKKNVVISKIIEVIDQEIIQQRNIDLSKNTSKKQEQTNLINQLLNSKTKFENKLDDNSSIIDELKTKGNIIVKNTEKEDETESENNNKSTADNNTKTVENNNVAKDKIDSNEKISKNDIDSKKSINQNNDNPKNEVVNKENETNNEIKTDVNSNSASSISNSSKTINETQPVSFKGNGIEVLTEPAYSNTKPIPVDVKLPEGIIFAVQIGAFKNPIPNDLFKGLSPVRGESTGKGLIRYQAGKFNKFEEANAVKNDLKKMGYRDAFVVIYKDGKLISMTEFSNLGIKVNANENQTAGITQNTNIPPASEVIKKMNDVASNSKVETIESVSNSSVTSSAVDAIKGLFYTVQVGVFSNNITSTSLYNINPIFTDKIQTNAYRFTAGIYSSIDNVKADRLKVVNLGVKDAFVSAYLDGKRIKVTDAITRINTGEKFIYPTEQPIRFSNSDLISTNIQVNEVQKNEVVSTENNTKENTSNSTKLNSNVEDIIYKIQIGAFKNEAGKEAKNKFSRISDLKIDKQQINNLFVYSAGSFNNLNEAKPALDIIKQKGIDDAFISVYKNGKKLYGEEAAKLLRR